MRAGADEWSERLQKQRQRYSDQDDMIDSSMRDVEQASKQGTETLQELGQQKERIHGFVERVCRGVSFCFSHFFFFFLFFPLRMPYGLLLHS